jgi:hypothetical protein
MIIAHCIIVFPTSFFSINSVTVIPELFDTLTFEIPLNTVTPVDVVIETLFEPSKLTDPVTDPDKAIVLHCGAF